MVGSDHLTWLAMRCKRLADVSQSGVTGKSPRVSRLRKRINAVSYKVPDGLFTANSPMSHNIVGWLSISVCLNSGSVRAEADTISFQTRGMSPCHECTFSSVNCSVHFSTDAVALAAEDDLANLFKNVSPPQCSTTKAKYKCSAQVNLNPLNSRLRRYNLDNTWDGFTWNGMSNNYAVAGCGSPPPCCLSSLRIGHHAY